MWAARNRRVEELSWTIWGTRYFTVNRGVGVEKKVLRGDTDAQFLASKTRNSPYHRGIKE